MSGILLGVTLTSLAVLGLLVGSFLNVVIHRVPRGLSLVRPGSACPACSHPIRAFDNVPVVSWLVLRGRCRDCHQPISPRYPAVELVTAALFVLVGLRFGWDGYTPAVLALVAGGVALFMIDLDRQRLPFAITGVVTVLVVVALAADVLVGSTAFQPVALASVGIWIGVYGGVWLATGGRGMGLGDVALAPLLGLGARPGGAGRRLHDRCCRGGGPHTGRPCRPPYPRPTRTVHARGSRRRRVPRPAAVERLPRADRGRVTLRSAPSQGFDDAAGFPTRADEIAHRPRGIELLLEVDCRSHSDLTVPR
jgi:leader peptidase (prepilin peptidase)/N-methyltransferase